MSILEPRHDYYRAQSKTERSAINAYSTCKNKPYISQPVQTLLRCWPSRAFHASLIYVPSVALFTLRTTDRYDHVQCLRCTLSPHLRRAPVTIGKVKMVKSVHPAVQLLFAYGKSINQSFRANPHAQLFSLLGGELDQVRLGFGRKTTTSHIVIAIR